MSTAASRSLDFEMIMARDKRAFRSLSLSFVDALPRGKSCSLVDDGEHWEHGWSFEAV